MPAKREEWHAAFEVLATPPHRRLRIGDAVHRSGSGLEIRVTCSVTRVIEALPVGVLDLLTQDRLGEMTRRGPW
jgi:hypothetical protein